MNDLERFFSLYKEKINDELNISTENLIKVEDFPDFLDSLSDRDKIKVMKLVKIAWRSIFSKKNED